MGENFHLCPSQAMAGNSSFGKTSRQQKYKCLARGTLAFRGPGNPHDSVSTLGSDRRSPGSQEALRGGGMPSAGGLDQAVPAPKP
jgi:hypothetical protein